MIKLLIFVILSVVLILGSALVLLRTAKKPKIPKSVKPQPYNNKYDD